MREFKVKKIPQVYTDLTQMHMYMYERNETSTDAEHTGKIKTRSRRYPQV